MHAASIVAVLVGLETPVETVIEGTAVTLQCIGIGSVEQYSMIDNITTSISWSGPNGPITSNTSDYTILPADTNAGHYLLEKLEILDLNRIRDNDNTYNCTMTVSSNSAYVMNNTRTSGHIIHIDSKMRSS